MEKDNRKKVINDKFNKLQLVSIDFNKKAFLPESRNTYGIYIDNQSEFVSINPDYFMFKFIGIDKDRWDIVDYYAQYIIDLASEKTFFTFDVTNSWYSVTFDRNFVDGIYDLILHDLSNKKFQ